MTHVVGQDVVLPVAGGVNVHGWTPWDLQGFDRPHPGWQLNPTLRITAIN
jgi:hypothetical protein